MYRSAARRLFPALCRRRTTPERFIIPRLLSTPATSEPVGNQNPSQFATPTSSSSSPAAATAEFNQAKDQRSRTTPFHKTQYVEEQARVLEASLHHVIRLGWTEIAMLTGAREVGVSPSIVGSFDRKEAALVEFFMDSCLQNLIDIIDSDEDLKNMIPSARVAKLVRTRLEMQAPYIAKWPQALSIQAQPVNVPASFKQRAMLVDEIWHAAGDDSSDVDWYVKRTVLGGIYSATELYMLTDASPDFRDTWTFLDGRIRDAFDLKKTIQEVKYLAEAVGAGMGGPWQGLMNRVLKNVQQTP